MLSYRFATPEDAKNLLSFFKALDKESDFMLLSEGERNDSVEHQENILSKSGENLMMLLALDDDEIVGFVVVSRGLYIRNKHLASLVPGVKKTHRNRGIGKQLIFQALEWCKRNGVTQVELTVAVENKPAISCYLSAGFVFSGVRKRSLKINEVFIDEYYMSRGV